MLSTKIPNIESDFVTEVKSALCNSSDIWFILTRKCGIAVEFQRQCQYPVYKGFIAAWISILQLILQLELMADVTMSERKDHIH
jgi:hypothetical protein